MRSWPSVLAATTAETALWVSIVSVTVALTGLAWQLTLYRLSGARLEVRLIPGVVTEVGHLARGPERGWRKAVPPDLNIVGDRPWIDVAIIQVINIGRAPVSVSELGLDFGHIPWWQPWSRHTITGRPVAIHEGIKQALEVRLEPGQSATVINDCWPLIEYGRRQDKRLAVRGTALPAGRKRNRSRWRRRWRIEPDQKFIWPHGPISDDLWLFQAIWRNVVPIDPSSVYPAWIGVSSLLSRVDDHAQPSFVEIADALDGVLEPAQAMQVATGVWIELQRVHPRSENRERPLSP